jgi:hypothetical protein
LLQNIENFNGPPLGPTLEELLHLAEPLHYFMKFWPPASMEHIVVKMNRCVFC